MRSRLLLTLALALAVTLVAAGCGGDDDGDSGSSGDGLSGTVTADGSSTVAPFTTAAAEAFQKENSGVKVTVGVSGTGGGFERFCQGETDLSDASRPIEDDEKQMCADNGIEYTEFQVANDALTVILNTENDWATCLTVDQLKQIWEPKSKITNWNQVDSSYPDEKLTLFGPGTDSGTFDYFTDVIVGEEGASRTDFSASEDDNVIVTGVTGTKGGMGYLGFSYFEENQDTLKALEVNGGGGCVVPSVETAQDGTYKPLSRPLFVYSNNASFEKAQVSAFVTYMIDNAIQIATDSQLVPLTQEQVDEQKTKLEDTSS